MIFENNSADLWNFNLFFVGSGNITKAVGADRGMRMDFAVVSDFTMGSDKNLSMENCLSTNFCFELDCNLWPDLGAFSNFYSWADESQGTD